MKKVKHYGAAIGMSYVLVQVLGLLMGAVLVTGAVGRSYIVSVLVVGFVLTAIPAVIYAAVLSAVLLGSARIRRSVVLASMMSVVLTAIFFAMATQLAGGSLWSPDASGLFACSALAGLVGTFAVRWYYGRVLVIPAHRSEEI